MLDRPEFSRLEAVPDRRSPRPGSSPDITGTGLSGEPVEVAVAALGGRTLLFFLASDCDGCREMWERSAEPAAWNLTDADRVVVVTREPAPSGAAAPRAGRWPPEKTEDPAAVRRLAPAGAVVVFSNGTWRDYRVSGPPFFVLVDGATRTVVVEGVAWGAEQVAGHVSTALEAAGGE